MILNGKNILLTGAAGGIGQPLAFALSNSGAHLALVDRDLYRIEKICEKINKLGGRAIPIVSNFKASDDIPEPANDVVAQALKELGSIDLLINSAGVLDFTLFTNQSTERIAEMMHINATVPIQLTRALLPSLLARNSGQIVNIGSIFGSIGFPHYATYCASKYAIHGFSQALRRELAETNLQVTYVAPRAVKTSMNEKAMAMLNATKTAMDDPRFVVAEIIKAIESDKSEHYIGQPESFFAWLNGVFPNMVSMGLKNQAKIARPFATNN